MKKILSPEIRSPWRYPGGKSHLRSKLVSILGLPRKGRFVDVFAGGGSIGLHAFSQGATVWLNDLHTGPFWMSAPRDGSQIVGLAGYWLNQFQSGRASVAMVLDAMARPQADPALEAARLWIRNRLTFSGCLSGGPGNGARFNTAAVNRLRGVVGAIAADHPRWHGTCEDFRVTLDRTTSKDFLFLDPPYERDRASRLYGEKGELHLNWRHQPLANALTSVASRWLMTVDDCPETREIFGQWHQLPWSKTYGMAGKSTRPKGAELLVANFDLSGVSL